MVSKNNHKLIAEKNRKNEKQRFALRKLNVGVASVLLGITFSIYGGGQMVAHADNTPAQGAGTESTVTSDKTPLAEQKTVTVSGSQNAGTDQNADETTQQKAVTDATPAENMGGESNY